MLKACFWVWIKILSGIEAGFNLFFQAIELAPHPAVNDGAILTSIYVTVYLSVPIENLELV